MISFVVKKVVTFSYRGYYEGKYCKDMEPILKINEKYFTLNTPCVKKYIHNEEY